VVNAVAPSLQGFVAAARFGLGAAPGELAAASADPAGWLIAQLDAAPAVPDVFDGLPTGTEAMAEFQRVRAKNGDGGAETLIRKGFRERYMREAGARTLAQIRSDLPFRERLVAFWSNHFTVSIQRPILLGLAGAFEREAIRPHVTGRFADLLLAVVRHQAMLAYLDNLQSFGPNSPGGRRLARGLNENLARELLELHTLGVDGGYTQDDVRSLAAMLTGWSVGRPKDDNIGAFTFHDIVHEPGTKTLLGKRYPEGGIDEAEAALADLARHPATARHLATKLVRHFVADDPPPASVERLADVFQETDGDLGAVARALVEAPAAWAVPLAKVKTPNELVVSALRATGYAGKPERLVGSLKVLGQLPFAAPSPQGWADRAADWVAPEALLERAEWAMAAARRLQRAVRPETLLEIALGPAAGDATEAAVLRAPSAADGIALLVASPEFQRR
jgi:uncharacterized protein (DUF1800 family)